MDENIIHEEIKLSYLGLSADKGLIDIKDLIRSLEGWNAFFSVTATFLLNRELSLRPLPLDNRPEIRIKAVERASVDITTVIWIPLGLMVAYDLFKVLMKWQIALVKKHIENKKQFLTKEEAIDAILLLATEYDIIGADDLEVRKSIDTIDIALNDLLVPIDYSASTLIITCDKTEDRLILSSSDKRALNSGYHIDEGMDTQGFVKASVQFIRINTETGKAIVVFENPKELNQIGHQYSEIIDSRVHEPKNAYTRALYEGSYLDVWCRKVINKRTNEFREWLIIKDLPSEENSLFEND